MIIQGRRGWGFETDFSHQEIPEAIDKERAKELTRRLRNGDTSVKQELIDGHIRLACSIVSKFLVGRRQKTDDILAAGLLGLCQAVEWAQERMVDDNIAPYIVVTVSRHIRDFLESDSLIPIPRKTFVKMIQDQLSSGAKLFNVLPLIQPIEKKLKEDEENEQDDTTSLEPTYYDEVWNLEQDELYERIHATEREKGIVQLLLEEWTYRDIAGMYGISYARVNQIVKDLRERVLNLGEEYEFCLQWCKGGAKRGGDSGSA